MFVMLAAIVLLADLHAQATAPAATARARLSGRVVSTYVAGVAGVTVVLSPTDGRRIDQRTTTTDSDGRFSFDGFEDGRYELSAVKNGYTSRRFNESTSSFDAGVSVALHTGATVENVRLPLYRSARLGGRVVRPDGAAAPGIQVVLARRRGRELITIAGTQTTTAWDGRYAITELPPGQYLLLASALAPRPRTVSSTEQAAFEINATRPDDFTPTLYPGVRATEPGESITLLEGVSSDGVDLWLVPTRRFSVSGRVSWPQGVTVDGITIEYGNPRDRRASVWTVSDPGGVFTVEGVAPGTVVLLATAESTRGRLMGVVSTDVHVGSVEDLSLRLEVPGQVEGRVVFSNDVPIAARPKTIRLMPKLLNVSPLYPVPESPIESDGRFQLKNVLGEYEIAIPDLPPGVRITRVSRRDQILAGNRIAIAGGETAADVSVTLGR